MGSFINTTLGIVASSFARTAVEFVEVENKGQIQNQKTDFCLIFKHPAGMRRGVATCAVLALCSGAAAQHTLTLDCCMVLNKLYAYMKVTDGYKCTGPDTGCASVKLMQQFVSHTKTAVHDSGMRTNGSDIVLSIPSNRNLEDLFVFAFFGRAASPAESTEVDLWLSYDTTNELIVFEDSTCDYNRNVYTLLVLSSMILLMFFIGVQVVRNYEHY